MKIWGLLLLFTNIILHTHVWGRPLSQEEGQLHDKVVPGWKAESRGDGKTAEEIFKATCLEGSCEACKSLVELNLKNGATEQARKFFRYACDCGQASVCGRIGDELELEKDIETKRTYYRYACQSGYEDSYCEKLKTLGAPIVKVYRSSRVKDDTASEQHKKDSWERQASGLPALLSEEVDIYKPEISFPSPIELNWREKAQEYSKGVNIEDPPQEFIERISAGKERQLAYDGLTWDINMPFNTPPAGDYYLLTNKEVIKLAVKTMNIEVSYRFAKNTKKVRGVHYLGEFVAGTLEDKKLDAGGFVLFSDSRIRISTSSFTDADYARFITDSGEKEFFASAYKVNLNPGNITYLIVSWNPPKMGVACEQDYDLYEIAERKSIVPKMYVSNYNHNCAD